MTTKSTTPSTSHQKDSPSAEGSKPSLPNKSSATSSPPLDRKAIFYMFLLAVQNGVQPVLTRRYTPPGISKLTVVLAQEVLKFVMAGTMLYLSGATQVALKDWTVHSWIAVAVLPAALYSIQNVAALTAYQNLDALTFNVLNQTKTLSAALCCYLVMGRPQSRVQIVALVMLLVAALVIESIISLESASAALSYVTGSDGRGKSSFQADMPWDTKHWTHGVGPILLASFISGLAGALSQKNLQQTTSARNAYLFSMELCVASCFFMMCTLTASSNSGPFFHKGLWKEWTWQTWIPIAVNAAGGIVVGLVTKYAGSVRKGFALIFGILLSGLIQAALEPNVGVSSNQVLGGVIAAVSLYLYAKNPPISKKQTTTPAIIQKKQQ